MSQIDLNSLTIAQLNDIEKNVEAVIKQKQREQVAEAYAQFQEIAKALGMSVEDILKVGKVSKKKLPVKYVNPNDKMQGWSGQGRTPKWLLAELEAGKKLEDFAV
ncbi:MAG: H-NS histone family protein [Moraxella sp.]|nr:H-NS histone family protein [Moraxella sp.]